MFAIIETGGKQYKVQEGDTILVDLFETPQDSNVVFDKVLLLQNDDTVTLGKPTVANASVSAEFISEEKGKKIDVFKMKRRKKNRKRQGHRQKYSMVKILKIQIGDSKTQPKAEEKKTAAKTVAKTSGAPVKTPKKPSAPKKETKPKTQAAKKSEPKAKEQKPEKKSTPETTE